MLDYATDGSAHEFEVDLGLPLIGEARFDPWLEPAGPRIGLLVDHVFAAVEERRLKAARQPRSDAVARRRRIVGAVVANLVATELSGSARRVSLSTANSAFTRYDRRDFPKAALANVIGELASLGMLLHTAGLHRVTTTVVEATDRLRALMISFGPITASELTLAPGGETILLRAPAARLGRRVVRGALVDYRDTAETIALRSEMSVINDFLNASRITVDGCPVVPFRLTRRFQLATLGAAPSFDLHGRIYDGFWINMHRDERYRIRVAGEELVDLDFTSMFTMIAYVMAGQRLPREDPYGGIEGLSPIGDAHEGQRIRDAVKRGVNAMFFRQGAMSRLPQDVKSALGPDWTAHRFRESLRRRHAPIAHLFETGLGLTLMYIESQIMVRFLLDLIDKGIPALPIHDGALVPTSKKNVALSTMRAAARSILGVALPAKAKYLKGSTPHHN